VDATVHDVQRQHPDEPVFGIVRQRSGLAVDPRGLGPGTSSFDEHETEGASMGPPRTNRVQTIQAQLIPGPLPYVPSFPMSWEMRSVCAAARDATSIHCQESRLPEQASTETTLP
jgi:hypothetical protein